MIVPYQKSFGEFLRFIHDSYARAEYPEAYVPMIAHKATAGFVLEKYFPEAISDFLRREGKYVYGISEPGWKNSPLNIRSELRILPDNSFELYANKAFLLDGEMGVFVAKVAATPSVGAATSGHPVRSEKEFALVIVDTDFYRSTRVRLEMPEATYRVGPETFMNHYRAEFTANLGAPAWCAISKREVLLLSRTIVFREQVAYAILAAAEAAKLSDMSSVESRVELLIKRAKEEPGQDDIAVAREILSAAIVRILASESPHGFWKWLGRFVKPA